MSNLLLVNYPPADVGGLVKFLSGQGFRCLPPVSSLTDKRIFAHFEKKAEDTKINVVLIDLTRSEGVGRRSSKRNNGIRNVHLFLKRIRAMDSTACVILTGLPIELEAVSSLLRGGVYDYLRSPVDFKLLGKTIKQGLKNKEQAEDIMRSMARANEQLAAEKDYLQRWSDNLSRIYEINQTLAGTLNIDDLICAFGENIKALVPYDTLSIFLKGGDSPDRAWVWVHSQGIASPNTVSNKTTLLKKFQEETIRSGNSFLLSQPDSFEAMVIKGGSEVAIPLFVSGKKVGVLRVSRDLKKTTNAPFDPHQTRILSMVTTPLCLTLRNAQMYQQVHELAATDELTHILNRRSFLHILEREFKRSLRLQSPLALLLVDLDAFKEVNDLFGHLTGDAILKEVAALLKQSVREIDILARYGGEEFVVILPEGEVKEAYIVAERIRTRVGGHLFNSDNKTIRLTVSIGMAILPSSLVDSPEGLFHLADSALYLAKRNGKNRTEIGTLNNIEMQKQERV